jgi:hypothetical protein
VNRCAKVARLLVLLPLAGTLAVLAGCKPNNAAPAPLPADQIPAEMRKIFGQARPETKEMVESMLGALQSTNYPAAYEAGQSISKAPEVTKEQLVLTARAMLEINALLKDASAQGDSNAAAFVRYQNHNR